MATPLSQSDREPADEEPDYYFEGGLLVYTEAFHLRRGYCCGNLCRHCPYGEEAQRRAAEKQGRA